jgi:regulator of replication initiation timing
MNTLQEQLKSLKQQLADMNRRAESIIVEDGSAEIVRQQLQEQIRLIEQQIQAGHQ